MHLPFTQVEFLNLFARFNVTFWPVLVILWVASAAAAVSLARGRASGRAVVLLLAVHWLWSGLAFHAWFFTRINPRADLFASMFVVQGLLFVWASGQKRLHVDWEASLRQLTGLAFLGLALAYPLLVLLSGHRLPAAPAFGVPCPTALFTVGVLLCSTTVVPRILLIVPLIWSVIGGSAAIVLGMTPDLLLLVGAVTLIPLLFPLSIRKRIDHWFASDADAAKPMTGDALAYAPVYEMTLTRVADARPEHVWPWLLQLGYRRGGLYSYDWLDRLFGYLDRPSAVTLLPEFQRLQPGDVIPIGRGGGFPVRTVRQNRSLLLGGRQNQTSWSWEIALDPIDETHTLITSRSRGTVPHTIGARVFIALLGPAAFLMTRRMLIGLARRAEDLAKSEVRGQKSEEAA
jgi:hypothetical protein